jgi:hypothetical protein
LAGWQSGHAADCKSAYAGSIPTPASKHVALGIRVALRATHVHLGRLISASGFGRPGARREFN